MKRSATCASQHQAAAATATATAIAAAATAAALPRRNRLYKCDLNRRVESQSADDHI